MWDNYKVDSLHAYGDYDEAAMFGYAAGIVMKAYIDFTDMDPKGVAAHFNEWMTAFGLFYINTRAPQVATLFTTHATTVGRSIAGNGKPLYDYMPGYFGDQMAEELNVQSKHSVEKQAAHTADCFTTVSEITDDECAQLLERRADVVTPNGFEPDFVPKGKNLTETAAASREKLIEVAERVIGYPLQPNVTICAIFPAATNTRTKASTSSSTHSTASTTTTKAARYWHTYLSRAGKTAYSSSTPTHRTTPHTIWSSRGTTT